MKPPANPAAVAILLGAALLFPGRAADPQTATHTGPASSELTQDLQRLGEAAQSLSHSLPSITCIETGVSEALKKNKVKKHVEFAATLRAVRTPEAGLHESFTVTQFNGKTDFKTVAFPAYSAGGFATALAYFLPSQQICYVYSLSPGRIDFETADDTASHPACRAEGVRGFALLDAEGNVTHIERTVPPQATHDFHLVPFAAIDFAPVQLNGHIYRLSHHILSEVGQEGDIAGRFEATYSNCQLFTATVKILPPTEVVPGSSPPQ